MREDIKCEEIMHLRALARSAARRSGLDEQHAEDVAQETLIALLESSKPVESPAAWVYTVARRASFLTIRRERRLKLQKLEDEPCSDFGLDERVELQRLVRRISKSSQGVVFQRAVEGYSVQEVVVRTGLSASTIKRRMARARGVIERMLSA